MDPQDKPTSRDSAGPDGLVRSDAQQRHLNEAVAMVFRSEAGKAVLAYLRSITLNAVCGPEMSDAGLRHREGMRHLVAIIETRIQAHHDEHAGPTTSPDASGNGHDTAANRTVRAHARSRRARSLRPS